MSHEEASHDEPPYEEHTLEELETKFTSLDEYVLNIKKGFVDQAEKCDPSANSVINPAILTQWCCKRYGAISMTRLVNSLPLFLDG
ncbi:hypothetical protein N7478_001212 [Penicillium angulare]|uniref:uncharacterized protein n=1 Tax=Penicillium angulare TaxID=116970 RepID=UPI0025403908|nr:uncharacterized protein N7478_001212 [Penicillium angulare]KAJ5291961.1 hypothetical protein N7478_001212 [Penicillium angulare]